MASCRPVDLVMAVTVRDAKSGWDRSCLQREVPRTPHPTTTRSDLAVTAGWGAEKARVGEDIVIRRRVRMRLILLAAMVL